MAPDYVFRPMTSADLPLVRRWLAEPHVVQWWGDPSEQYDLVSGDLDVGFLGFALDGRRPHENCFPLAAWGPKTRPF